MGDVCGTLTEVLPSPGAHENVPLELRRLRLKLHIKAGFCVFQLKVFIVCFKYSTGTIRSACCSTVINPAFSSHTASYILNSFAVYSACTRNIHSFDAALECN